MKAIVIDGYGDVDQLHLRELPDPRPQADEVLVRVRAAGVNPVDWKIRQGQLRFILRPKFPFVPGGDIAGEVVSTGPEAARRRPAPGCASKGNPFRLRRHQAPSPPKPRSGTIASGARSRIGPPALTSARRQ